MGARSAFSQNRCAQSGDVVAVQAGELNQLAARELARQLRTLLTAVGTNQKQRPGRQRPAELTQHFETIRPGPVQVLEQEERRPPATEQGGLDRSHEALASGLGIDLDRVRDVALEQRRQVGDDSLEHAGRRRRRRIIQTEPAQRIGEHAEIGVAIAACLHLQHAGAFDQRQCTQLVYKARLADAALTRQKD